jgi:nucleotide-binding universal stress UspA family protein
MMPPPMKRGFRSILCAVDFSPPSAKALRYAAALARACGGRVTAIYAADPLLTAAVVTAYDSHVLERNALADLEKFVRASVPGTPARADIRSVVQVGAPGPVVLAFARRAGRRVARRVHHRRH